MITGGTGSFGQAMARALLGDPVKAIRIVSRDEFKQSEMAKRFTDPRLRFLLGDVRDRDRLRRAFEGAEVVIHAAALKRIDSGERDPLEFKKTNVDGAANIVEAAIDAGVRRVVALSTDKAAAPLTLYGASKLLLEKVINAGNAYGGGRTEFLCVRYGNVVGSRGSLVPMLLQARTTGGVTITDPRCTRFWMTLGEAVALVRRAVEYGYPGTVLIPQLPSVRITDLFEAILGRFDVPVTGMRGAEKLHEALISADEALVAGRCHSAGVDDYVLGLPGALGIQGPYDSETNPKFLGVPEIRERLPMALAEAGL